MVQMLCRNRVKDFAVWKTVFDSHLESQSEAGLKLVRLWRGVDDPNNVFFLFDVEDIDKAKAFTTDDDAVEAGERAGVIDGEIHFVETI